MENPCLGPFHDFEGLTVHVPHLVDNNNGKLDISQLLRTWNCSVMAFNQTFWPQRQGGIHIYLITLLKLQGDTYAALEEGVK